MDYGKREDDSENRPMVGSPLYNGKNRKGENVYPENYEESRTIAEEGNAKIVAKTLKKTDKKENTDEISKDDSENKKKEENSADGNPSD